VPKEFTHENGRLTGVVFEKVKAQYDAKGRRNLVPTGEPDQHFACDDVLVAVGQENAFPWIDRDIGIEFDKWGMPKVDPRTMASSHPRVFFGGDAAFGPKNIIWAVAHRCLNCDVQTVFTSSLCIECDACVDICPMDCITFTSNGEEADLRTRLRAPAKNVTQDLYVANDLKTGRVMVKDEDVCLHCGLCAERCPTGAWDMKKYLIDMTHANDQCRVAARSAA
jgi:ferredoxin